ncbi:MAG TPA: ABC transporter substrate-binding protein [Thermoanaerobaculia bacterium]
MKNATPNDTTNTTSILNAGSLSRRDVLFGLGSAALLYGPLAACRKETGASATARPVPLNVNSPTLTTAYIPILDSVPLIVAHAKGFLTSAGVKSEKPVLIRAWPALLEAFTAQKVLLTHVLLPQVIVLRYMRKVPLRTVGFNHTDVVAMAVSKQIGTLPRLGGKVVGCPTWWAPHTGIFQDVLRSAGLRPVVGKEQADLAADEVAFRVLAPPDMVEGLKSGGIAGCTVSEPFGAAAEVLAGATIVKMSGDVWRDHPCCQSVMLESNLNRDRKWAEAVTTAIYQAALWANNNREELADLLGSDGGGYFPMPKAVIRRALLKQDLDTYGPRGTGAIMHTDWNVYRVKFVPYPYASAFQTTIDMMRRMVVDPASALSPAMQTLTGDQIRRDILDEDLANKGIAAVGGIRSFGLDSLTRTEQYDVVLKPNEKRQ